MRQKYSIEVANVKDEHAILTLARNIANNFTRHYLGDKVVDEYINSGCCDEDIQKEISNMLTLIFDNEIIGLMIWHQNKMQGFMVSLQHHGTGAAQYFCDQVIPEKLKLYDELYLECFEKNERGLAFYKKTGWHVYGMVEDELTGGYRMLLKHVK